jgi:hypothetical protein
VTSPYRIPGVVPPARPGTSRGKADALAKGRHFATSYVEGLLAVCRPPFLVAYAALVLAWIAALERLAAR